MRRSAWKHLAAGCALVLAACGDPTGSGGDPVELGRALDRWNAQHVDDYRMTIRRQGGMIGGAAVITVRDGVPVSVQGIAPFEGLSAGFFAAYDTVEDLFHIVVNAFENDAHRIEAEYDPRLGVPLDVYIDPSRNAVDEEHGFVIESFEIL